MNTKIRAVVVAVAVAGFAALGVTVDSSQLASALDALTAGCNAPPVAPSPAPAPAADAGVD